MKVSKDCVLVTVSIVSAMAAVIMACTAVATAIRMGHTVKELRTISKESSVIRENMAKKIMIS